MAVAQRALDFLRQRELEHRRRDERRERVAHDDGNLAARDLVGVRGKDVERRAADGVRDDRPRLRRRAQPLVERQLVEDDPFGLMKDIGQVARGCTDILNLRTRFSFTLSPAPCVNKGFRNLEWPP